MYKNNIQKSNKKWIFGKKCIKIISKKVTKNEYLVKKIKTIISGKKTKKWIFGKNN